METEVTRGCLDIQRAVCDPKLPFPALRKGSCFGYMRIRVWHKRETPSPLPFRMKLRPSFLSSWQTGRLGRHQAKSSPKDEPPRAI